MSAPCATPLKTCLWLPHVAAADGRILPTLRVAARILLGEFSKMDVFVLA